MRTDIPVTNETSVNEGTGVFQIPLLIVMCVFDVWPVWRQKIRVKCWITQGWEILRCQND